MVEQPRRPDLPEKPLQPDDHFTPYEVTLSEDDLKLAQTALRMSLITQLQLDECVNVSRRLTAAGLTRSISQVLLEKKYLTREQMDTLLVDMGKPLAQLSHYDVLTKLGEGGMGAVYKVRDQATGEMYALKILKKDLAGDEEYLTRFRREVRNTFTLVHPNIVGAVEAGMDKGFHFLVVEYVDGEPLEHRIDDQEKLSEIDAARITIQIAEALAYASTHHIVHRDIKPSNVMITREDKVKVCDLGIAKSTEAGMTLTQTGFTVGSPHYISPEQARGDKELDIRSDIYSLGVTLFHMVTGRLPFEADNAHAVVNRRLNEAPPNPQEFNPDLSNRMAAIILKMMMREPELRYQIPEEVVMDLEPVTKREPDISAEQVQEALRQARGPEPEETPFWKNPTVLTALGGSVVLILLALVYFGGVGLGSDDEANAEEKRREVQELYDQAQQKFKQGDFAGAVQDCDRVLKLDPDFSEAGRLKGEAGKAEEERMRREAAARAETERRQKEALKHYNIGTEKYNREDYAGAIADWQKAVDLDPGIKDEIQPWLESAREKAKAGPGSQKQKAEEHYRKGEAKYSARDLTGAIGEYNQAIELDPANAGYYHARGMAFDDLDNLKKASDDYSKAILLNPKSSEAYNNRGLIKYKEGDLAGALKDLGEAVKHNPNYAVAFYNRGAVRKVRGDAKGAVADWEKAIRLDPSYKKKLQPRIDELRINK